MKKLLSTLGLALLSLSCFAIETKLEDNVCSIDLNNSESNSLLLQGQLKGGYPVTMVLYSYEEGTNVWIKQGQIDNVEGYCIRLDPTKDYKIWFLCPLAGNKILEVQSGCQGVFRENCDIDFSVPGTLFSKIQQDINTCDYSLESKDNSITLYSSSLALE